MSAPHAEDATRRDFLYIATGAAGAVAAVGVGTVLVSQMGPNAAERAAGAPVEIDISAIEEGQVIVAVWRGKPYFIRHLTDEEVAAAQSAEESGFSDFEAADVRLGAPADGKEGKWTIVAANCTHLGCIPTKVDTGFEGWFCPCHGSKFDVTGRVIKGPAPTNLPLPPYNFASDTTLVIGADKAGA